MSVDSARTPTAAPTTTASSIRFTLRTKGPLGLAARAATISTRFGPTPRTMVRRLDHMLARAEAAGFRPSCPVTATVLARHPDVIRALADRGMEFPIHGLRHNDHVALDDATQTRDIAQALRVFEGCGLRPTGFRAPYLRANDATARAVLDAGLVYQSDDAIAFPTGLPHTDGYRRALEMYDAQDAGTTAARPSLVDGLVRIPVCVPDDEMLVDRLRLADHDCGRMWCGILETTHAAGDLFTMQVHPERFVRSEAAVQSVLDRAAGLPGGVWRARLDEIAQWWLARSRCRLEPQSLDDGGFAVTLTGDPRATMRLVGGRRPHRPGSGTARRLVLPAGPLPAVGVAPGVPESVVRFLEEDGYLVSTRTPESCAVQLGADVDPRDQVALRRRVLSADHPVVALDRWPDGRRSALALTGDVDALTVQDFYHRLRENAHGVPSAGDGATS